MHINTKGGESDKNREIQRQKYIERDLFMKF